MRTGAFVCPAGHVLVPFWFGQIASGLRANALDPGVYTARPESHRSVAASGGDRLAVRAERQAVEGAGVAGQGLADRLAGGGVPQPYRLVVASGGDRLAVRAERQAVDGAGVAGQGLADRLAGGGIPQPH